MSKMIMVKGFTLAELLIALAILGVIATFTIPKVLVASRDSQNNAIAKEVAATISGALQAAKADNAVSASTKFGDLLPYLNYVKVDSTSSVDDIPPFATPVDCSGGQFNCYRMHNGAIVFYESSFGFGGTANTNAIWVAVDPDGKDDDVQSVLFWLYYNGRITSKDNILPGTTDGFGLRTGDPGTDPTWFSWN